MEMLEAPDAFAVVLQPPELVEDLGPAWWRPGAMCSQVRKSWSRGAEEFSRHSFFLSRHENFLNNVNSHCFLFFPVAGNTLHHAF